MSALSTGIVGATNASATPSRVFSRVLPVQ